MGSFNVSCSTSNLSISYGDKIMFIPLTVNKYFSNLNSLKTSQFIYNDDIYQPFLLPIEGIYNDYGGVEDIVHNENTKLIEKIYGYTIEEIIDSICEGSKLKQKDDFFEVPNLGGMFVLKEIYDDLKIMDLKGYGPECITVDSLEYNGDKEVVKSFLEKWGFVFKEMGIQNSFKDRDCEVYEKNGVLVKLNEYNIEIGDDVHGAYSAKDFIKQWNKRTNDTISLEDIRSISYKKQKIQELFEEKPKSVSDKNFDNILESILEDMESDKKETPKETEQKKMSKEDIEMFKEIEEDRKKMNKRNLIKDISRDLGLRNWRNISSVYIENYIDTKNEMILDELIEFTYYNTMLVCGNIMYKPSCGGLQDGGSGVSNYIAKSILKVSKKQVKEYEESQREYEED